MNKVMKCFFIGALAVVVVLLAIWIFNRSKETARTDAALVAMRIELDRLSRSVERIDRAVLEEVRKNAESVKIDTDDVAAVLDDLVRQYRERGNP